MTLFIFFVLNLSISIFNAWGVGHTWDSTKAKGGFAHFMNWMGGTMSACGFTWCYMVILGFICINITTTDEATKATTVLLDPKTLQAFADLGYIVIILPILGSGLAITIHSWRALARRRSGTDMLITGWNTFAQINNMMSAARHLPGAFDRTGDFFSGDNSNGKDKLVLILVAVAVFGGILTTYGIVQSVRKSVRLNDRLRA